MGPNSGGVHRCTGQTKGQRMNPGRRGFKGPKYGLWDLLSSSESATKVVVMVVVVCAQGSFFPCRFKTAIAQAKIKFIKIKQA